MYKGSCLCGAVKYEVLGEIKHISHCHCSMCRKAHGAAFASYGGVRWEEFRVVQGEESIARFESSADVTRTFCKTCGSNLQWYSHTKNPEWFALALGSLDTPLTVGKQKHIHTENPPSWYPFTEEGGSLA